MKKKFYGICAVGLTVALSAACLGCSSTTGDQAASGSSAKDAIATEAASTVGARYVSTSWLKDHVAEVQVVDARAAEVFAAGHIPGAVNLHWTSVSNVAVAQGKAGWGDLVATADLAKAATDLGIDNSKPVVVYTDPTDGWGEDGRIQWTLGEAGLSDVYILDGGWKKWTADGCDTTVGVIANDKDSIEQVDTAFVKKNMSKAKIVDARAADEFSGKLTMGEARKGHIPGAINVPSVNLYNEDGTLKSADDLNAMFTEAGLDKGDEVIVYCTGGVRAANVAEVMKGLGFEKVNVYTAGFSEWAGDNANKVEK